MSALSPLFIVLGIFCLGIGVPIFAAKVWTHHRLKNGEASVTRFDPKPDPVPGIFLRHFHSPQRAYLRQRRSWQLGYLICSWVLFLMFCEWLPPQMADSYGSALTLPQSVWYVNLRAGVGNDLFICGVAAALFATVAVRRKSMVRKFERTRPLTLRFLFWARTGLALTTLLASIATAAVGFLLLLLIFYGPVWNHVPSAISAQGITELEAHDLISTLQTSPVRPVLSLLTTSTLIFSVIVALRSLPWGSMPKPNSTFPTTSVVVASIEFPRPRLRVVLYWILGSNLLLFSLIWAAPSLQFARRMLFLYNHHDVGPPPYACALIPIVIAAALLWLAQFFNARNEIP